MGRQTLQELIDLFDRRRDLPLDHVEHFLDAILRETDEAVLTNLLLSWEEKGTTEDELFALASLLRSRMKRIRTNGGPILDIVGTGGSRSKSFNGSTAAAFVVAGAGLAVAKHGNRAATSSSGSADVLDHLGINVDIQIERTQECLQRHSLCFLFAPRFHSLSPALARARRRLGRPTIFNCLGPLCNPAGATHQVIGVWDRDRIKTMANVLSRLGTKASWVVHGHSGLDEIELERTFVDHVSEKRRTIELTGADFGFGSNQPDLPVNMSAGESAKLIREILENKRGGQDVEHLVLVNAAAAIHLAGKADDLAEGVKLARESIRSGKAMQKLSAVAEETRK